MVFCNEEIKNAISIANPVTILILIDGFLQLGKHLKRLNENDVTILILIDGFLQCIYKNMYVIRKKSQSLF